MTKQAAAQLSWIPILPRASKLAVVEVLALALIGTVAYGHQGMRGLAAALLSACVCWMGAVVALIVTGRRAESSETDPSRAIAMAYVAMMLRGAIPLMAIVVVQVLYPRWGEAGLMIYVVPFYLVTLASETVFSVMELRATSGIQKQTVELLGNDRAG